MLREPLKNGPSGYPGPWCRKGQILRNLGRKGGIRKAAQEALKLDLRHLGGLMENLGQD